MLNRFIPALIALSAIGHSATAVAASPQTEGLRAFNIAPVRDEALAASFGGESPFRFQRNIRGLSDSTNLTQLQQVGQTSRIALDNWWSQTGAALIVENVLAQPVR